jgi:hypothetical protein
VLAAVVLVGAVQRDAMARTVAVPGAAQRAAVRWAGVRWAGAGPGRQVRAVAFALPSAWPRAAAGPVGTVRRGAPDGVPDRAGQVGR